MFKRLREKVENVESLEKNGTTSPSSTRPNRGTGRAVSKWKADDMRRTDSATSLSGSETDMPTESSSKEHLHATLMQRTMQVKKLEIKLADYAQSLKECSKERDKLVSTLEKQQDSTMRRLSELDGSYTESKKRMEKTILALEKREADLTETVEKLQMENEKLQVSVEEWQNEKDELEKKRDEFFAKRDNREELQDLQMQELAKIKHLLMNSEKEGKRCQEELDLRVAELLRCRETNDEMESSLRLLTESLDSSRKQLEAQIQANEKLSIQLDSSEKTISALRAENSESKEKIVSLTKESFETRSSISALESAHCGVNEKYQNLRQSSEAVINKATLDLEEKECVLDHLKQKISSLEQRIKTDTLPENEQMQALIEERRVLENRLEECQQQLVNIKSTWSTKINQLEQQVSHLNVKIAEDSEEISAKNKKLSEFETSSKKQIEYLETQLQTLEHEAEKNYLHQVTNLEADFLEKTTKYELECSRLEQNAEQISNLAKTVEMNLREQVKQLTQLQEDYEKRMKEWETKLSESEVKHNTLQNSCDLQIHELEAELKDMHKEISSRDCVKEEISSTLEKTRQARNALRDKCNKLEEECKNLAMQLQETQSHLDGANQDNMLDSEKLQAEGKVKLESTSSNLEALQFKLSGKEKELTDEKNVCEKKEALVKTLNENIQQMTISLQSREEELMNCKEQIASLKNNQTEDNEEVSNLKEEKSKIEEKLTERDRLIKVQQQRLNDLKKALQKELNKRGTGAINANTRFGVGGTTEPRVNGVGSSLLIVSEEVVSELPAVGMTSVDDPNLSLEQREITVKYLKHVLLTFLSCSQSEAQQLIKAMSMLLNFNKDEEKFVKEVMEYRSSWFGSKPSTKKVVKSSIRRDRR